MLVVVPDLVGMTREQAEADLTDRGLNPVVKNRETDPADADPGTVVDQNPKDGVEVAKGADVTIFIAVEPTTTTVPDLEGLTPSAAQTELERGRTPPRVPAAGTERRRSLPGRSRGPSPPPASEIEQDSVVDVFVSTGPEQVTVPDVSTGCLSMGGARKALKDAGLETEVGDPQPSVPDCPNPNRIIGQEPAGGNHVGCRFGGDDLPGRWGRRLSPGVPSDHDAHLRHRGVLTGRASHARTAFHEPRRARLRPGRTCPKR